MVYVQSFRDLEVYKLSKQLSKEVFELSKQFPKDEMYSLTDQIRRSSRSVGAQIAESWAKRKYEKYSSVGKMLSSMISKAEFFCNR